MGLNGSVPWRTLRSLLSWLVQTSAEQLVQVDQVSLDDLLSGSDLETRRDVGAITAVRGRSQVRNVSRPRPARAEGVAVEKRHGNLGLFLPHPLQLVHRLAGY